MRAERGFTLIELLVVIGILGLLIAIALPAVMESRESARRASCMNNQHNLALAIVNFEQARRHYPGYRNLQAVKSDGMARSISWVFPLLPYFEQTTVHQNHGDRGPADQRGQIPNVGISVLVCPSDTLAASAENGEKSFNSYIVNAGQIDSDGSSQLPADWRCNGIFMDRFPYALDGSSVRHEAVSSKFVSQRDGLGKTLLLSENCDSGQWYDDTEALAGFVWEATLVDGVPSRVVTKQINEGIGTSLLSTASANSRPAFQVSQRGSSWPILLGCVGCFPRPPIPIPPPVETPDEPESPLPPVEQPPAVVGNVGNISNARPSSQHRSGVLVSFADGRVQFLSEEVDYLVYCLLMTPSGADAQFPGTADLVPAVFRTTPLTASTYQ